MVYLKHIAVQFSLYTVHLPSLGKWGKTCAFCILQVETELEAEPMRPTHLLLVLDNSGSMAGRKLESAKAAVASFYQTVLQADNSIALESSRMIVFNSWVTEFDFTGKSYEQIVDTIQAVRVEGGTNFNAAIQAIAAQFAVRHGSRFFIAFFSDGQVVKETLLCLTCLVSLCKV